MPDGFFILKNLDLEVVDVGGVDRTEVTNVSDVGNAVGHWLFFTQMAWANGTFRFVNLEVNPGVVLSPDNL